MHFRVTIIIIFFNLIIAKAFANHLVGGELTYTCMDSSTNKYLIKLELYRDCAGTGAEFDNSLSFIMRYFDSANTLIYSRMYGHGPIVSLDPTGNDPCLQIQGNICVEETQYIDSIILPPRAGGYQIVYQRYSRNIGIKNLIVPNMVGSVFYASVPDSSLAKCNSSPEFINYPPIAICVNEQLIFDHSAIDPDGDSLVYKLCDPLDTKSEEPIPSGLAIFPPYPIVPWGAGYSAQNPLDGTISIDSATGLLSAFPTQIGKYVVGICVEEYRNDTLLSKHFRDFQFNIVDCINPSAAIVDYDKLCNSTRTVNFPDTSENASNYFWDFGDTTTLADTSILAAPSYTYPDTGTYIVTLIINKGSACSDTAYETLELRPDINAEFSYFNACITDSVNFLDNSTVELGGHITSRIWYWEDSIGSDSSFKYLFDSSGTFQIKLIVTSNFNCIDSITHSVELYPLPVFDLGPDTAICYSDTITFTVPQENVTYTWNPNTYIYDIDSIHPFSVPASLITYYVTAMSTDLCQFRDTITVSINPLPEVSANPDSILINRGEEVQIQTTGASIYDWNPKEWLTNASIPDPIARPPITYIYIVTGTDGNGCINYDTVKIYVKIKPQLDIPSAFSPGNDDINNAFELFYYDLKNLIDWKVYTRWGQVVFVGSDLTDSWDGKFKGKDQETGVYIYQVKAEDYFGGVITRTGTVTLIR